VNELRVIQMDRESSHENDHYFHLSTLVHEVVHEVVHEIVHEVVHVVECELRN